MQLDLWAQRWKIPLPAILELKQVFGVCPVALPAHGEGISESAVQSLLRLEATRKGLRLWRNNVGATLTNTGAFIRFGLANDSKAVNRQIKSADLIGIRPVKIKPHMVGYTVGQFVSREVKHVGWKWRGDDREIAQMRWAELIISMGGDAAFAIGEGTL